MQLIPSILLILVLVLSLKSSRQNVLIKHRSELRGGTCLRKVIKPFLERLPELQKELQECKNEDQETSKFVLQGTELLQLKSQLEELEKLLANMDPWTTECTKPPRENKFCENINGKHYFVDYLVKDTWDEAYNFCRKMGGHLVSLKTEEEWTALRSKLDVKRRFWTDITTTNGQVISETTGTEPNFTKFSKKEPNNNYGYEDCVILWNEGETDFEMNDVPCSEKDNFICERY